MFDPDRLLADVRPTHPRLLFYPSCGTRCLANIMTMDGDLFAFADSFPRDQAARSRFWNDISEDALKCGTRFTLVRSTVGSRIFRLGSKWGFLFFQDNNEVLARLRAAGYAVSCFLGTCDGCCEGGNYECVHESPFLEKVLSTTSSQSIYITDHSPLLVDPVESEKRGHTFFRHEAQHFTQEGQQYLFRLNSVLVRAGHAPSARTRLVWALSRQEPPTSDYFVFRPETMASGGSVSMLPALARYRAIGRDFVIAQYDVCKGRSLSGPS